jgi:hypothetical protein
MLARGYPLKVFWGENTDQPVKNLPLFDLLAHGGFIQPMFSCLYYKKLINKSIYK